MTIEFDDDLMTAEEVAKRLRLKATTIYEAAADGRIPCVRLWRGKRKTVVRFRRREIENFIAEHAVDLRTAQVK